MELRTALEPVKRITANRRTVSLSVSGVVLIWSIVELVSLALRHTAGPEIYGVLVAAIAVAAGSMTVLLLVSRRRQAIATAAALLLWAVVALGGLAGAVVHVTGAGPAEPADPRPRPAGAPLVFVGLALSGGAALVYGQRTSLRRTSES
jgi:hypothetical protein